MKPLFSRETHTNFPREPVADPRAIKHILAGFSISGIQLVESVRKRNPTSSIYFVTGKAGKHVARSVSAMLASQTSIQCRIARNDASPWMIRPLTTVLGADVTIVKNIAWMAYEAAPGSPYDGRNKAVDCLVTAAVSLTEQLMRRSAGRQLTALAATAHRPDQWRRFGSELADGSLWRDARLAAEVPPELRRLAKERAVTIECLVAEAVETAATLSPRLVHNDINHANVIVDEGQRPIFIDLEDICYEDPGVAMGHAVFKLVRHAIFAGGLELDTARRRIFPAALDVATDIAGSRERLLRMAALRIISDIFEITAGWVERNDPSNLWDLGKRVSNLLELIELAPELTPVGR